MYLCGIAVRSALAWCLAVGIAVAPVVFLSPKAEAVQNEAEAVIGVVSAFYDKYLKTVDTPVELLSWLRQQPEADAAFVEGLEKLFNKAEESEFEGLLPYDPILMAQDFPTGMEYARQPVIDGAAAELIAYTLWGDEPEGHKSPLCVSLIKREGVWRITGVLDMRDEEAKACGGMEPGGRP